jgi:hypothetical protein
VAWPLIGLRVIQRSRCDPQFPPAGP